MSNNDNLSVKDQLLFIDQNSGMTRLEQAYLYGISAKSLQYWVTEDTPVPVKASEHIQNIYTIIYKLSVTNKLTAPETCTTFQKWSGGELFRNILNGLIPEGITEGSPYQLLAKAHPANNPRYDTDARLRVLRR